MGDRDKKQEPAPADNRPPAFSFLNLAQTLGAYLALPVVLLYPFGFVALFAQFINYFRLDFYTAWYAASLVNRVVILGQGATILAVALVGGVLLSHVRPFVEGDPHDIVGTGVDLGVQRKFKRPSFGLLNGPGPPRQRPRPRGRTAQASCPRVCTRSRAAPAPARGPVPPSPEADGQVELLGEHPRGLVGYGGRPCRWRRRRVGRAPRPDPGCSRR